MSKYIFIEVKQTCWLTSFSNPYHSQIFRTSYGTELRRADDDNAVDEDEIKQVEMKKNFIFAMFGAHRRSPAKLNRKRRDSNFRQMTYKKFVRVDKIQ